MNIFDILFAKKLEGSGPIPPIPESELKFEKGTVTLVNESQTITFYHNLNKNKYMVIFYIESGQMVPADYNVCIGYISPLLKLFGKGYYQKSSNGTKRYYGYNEDTGYEFRYFRVYNPTSTTLTSGAETNDTKIAVEAYNDHMIFEFLLKPIGAGTVNWIAISLDELEIPYVELEA